MPVRSKKKAPEVAQFADQVAKALREGLEDLDAALVFKAVPALGKRPNVEVKAYYPDGTVYTLTVGKTRSAS